MSNKAQKRGLIPKLRFPAFRDAGEWGETPLGEIINLEYGSSLSEQNRKGGRFPVVGASGVVGFHDEYLVSGPAVVIGRKGSAGQVNWINSDCYPIDTTFFVNNKRPDDYLLSFLKLVLERSNLTSLKDGGAVPGLNRNEVHAIRSLFPKSREQQKIADCLASLDERITLEAQKLDTLKTHKKGLMQQLFPAEGETLPKLRFPEFRDAGEWSINSLGNVAENLDSRRVPITENDRAKGDVPYYGASGVIDYVKDYIFDEELLCVSEDGANLIARAYPIAFSISGKTWVNNHAHVLKFKSSFIQVIVENYLNSISLEGFLTGMAQPKLNRAKLDIIPIPLPQVAGEQQKIADCLSSLDELVAAQTQKLDTLKAHKKGLQQQLFPSFGGVAGEA